MSEYVLSVADTDDFFIATDVNVGVAELMAGPIECECGQTHEGVSFKAMYFTFMDMDDNEFKMIVPVTTALGDAILSGGIQALCQKRLDEIP